ncbi:hypothetical protein FACS1894208_07760 [Clostridia bacterium]|nr:hypothetical protein FACS1894208_07760 [Clostridia bacterium]
MTPNDQLYAKLSAEYDAYIDELKTKSADEILVAAFEKVQKEEIIIAFETSFYGDDECAALLKLDNTLDEIYREWLDTDASDIDAIQDCINGVVERETGHGKEIEPDPSTRPVMAINGEVDVGNWVIAVTETAYSGLIGQVIAVDKIGTDEHETDNPGDDVHVDFTRVDYQPDEILAIEANFAKLYGEHKPFAELPLDDVIISPEMLVSLTGRDIEPTNELTESYGDVREYANARLNMHFDNREEELIERFEQNYAEYQQTLQSFGANELIDMAAKIHAMSDAYSYATAWHGWNDDEIDFYLQFANPLEVIADAWHERNVDLDEMSFTMDFISEHRDNFLTQYALMDENSPAEIDLPRFTDKDAAKSQEQSEPQKELSAFEKSLNRGKAKVAAYKAEQAQNPTDKTKNNKEERD